MRGGEKNMVLADFMLAVTGVMGVVTTGIGMFLQPPLVWFVALGLGAAGIGIAKGLIPKKKAK
jgi:hypothetical protein